MRHFRRSLRYLRPYRLRLGVAVACVLCIAALWGGGLGLILPASKVLLSPEGLHGWAYATLAEDHFRAKLVEQDAPEDLKVDSVLEVLTVEAGGPAGKAGLTRGNWILGTDGQAARGRNVLRRLAQVVPGRSVDLLVRQRDGTRALTVSAGQENLFSRVLKRLVIPPTGGGAALLPEPETYGDRFPVFVRLLLLALAITLARSGFTFIQEYLVGTAIWRGILDLRADNYNVVLRLPTSFFSEKGVSDATSRFIQDTNELARGQNTLLGKTLVEPAKAVGALALALWMSWQLTVMAMLAGPPAFWVIRRLGRKMHKASRRALESWSSMLAVLSETLVGIRVVKSYTMEATQRRHFFQVNRRLLKQQNRMERLDAGTGPAVEALGFTAGMLAAGAAGYLVFRGLSVGGYFYLMDRDYFLTWMVALFALFDPVRKLAKVSTKFQQAEAAAQRIFELQDTPQERVVAQAPPLPRHSQSLEFRNVCFRYPSSASDALKHVNLTVPAGATVAIVGPNGSGKTTLVSLVPRLLEPTAGAVLIDGREISQYSLRSLRRQIGLVTQDPILFQGTIWENIACGQRHPRDEAVRAAAQKAFVDEFVCDLPTSYQTLVGEYGARLSGGQRQRIAIARAILRDPAILIFDEALSQIDSDSEQKIHQALAEFRKGRTTLIVAHRFTTILEAERIAVLDDGRIVDVGTHDELLGRCRLYRQLYQTQFGGRAGPRPAEAARSP